MSMIPSSILSERGWKAMPPPGSGASPPTKLRGSRVLIERVWPLIISYFWFTSSLKPWCNWSWARTKAASSILRVQISCPWGPLPTGVSRV